MYTIIGIVGSNRENRLKLLSQLADRLSKEGYNVISITREEGSAKYSDRSISVSITDCSTFIKAGFKLGLNEIKSLIAGKWRLIMVEGLKTNNCILAASSVSDIEEYGAHSMAIVPFTNEIRRNHAPQEAKIVDVDGAIAVILNKMLKEILSILAQQDCGECGYGNCQELAKAIARGEETPFKCVKKKIPVKIMVNGDHIQLNPFTTKMFAEVIKGLLSILKGVPREIRNVTIEINFD